MLGTNKLSRWLYSNLSLFRMYPFVYIHCDEQVFSGDSILNSLTLSGKKPVATNSLSRSLYYSELSLSLSLSGKNPLRPTVCQDHFIILNSLSLSLSLSLVKTRYDQQFVKITLLFWTLSLSLVKTRCDQQFVKITLLFWTLSLSLSLSLSLW